MKNTDRLSDKILEIIRYMHTGHEKDRSKDDDINTLTPNEIFREFLKFHGFSGFDSSIKKAFVDIYGLNEDMLLSRADEWRTWCCWVLDEEEVLHAMKEVVIPESYGLDESDENKEAFIKDVVEMFKQSISVSFDDWETVLDGCVSEVVDTWRANQDAGGD